MPFRNPAQDHVSSLLLRATTIAVVGLSADPQRPSYEVAAALRTFGYRVIPVNPRLAVWEGLRAVPSLDRLPDALGPDERVDIVNVFRRPQHLPAIVDDCIRLKLPALWLQLGVIDAAAAERAQSAGLTVVMDRCIKVERRRLARENWRDVQGVDV
jgi:predicted CoA-binding protein